MFLQKLQLIFNLFERHDSNSQVCRSCKTWV